MLVHQFTTELDKGTLVSLMRETTMLIIVRDGKVMTGEDGFTYVTCTLLLERVAYDHVERRFNPRDTRISGLLN